jgi:beta-lactamase class A
MSHHITRRAALAGSLLAAPLVAALPASAAIGPALAGTFAELEKSQGGRLGIAVLDTASGARAGHRADERFPMCSTFKWLAAAHVLARVDRGEEQLHRRVIFGERDLVPFSPATKPKATGQGMTVAELCEAAIIHSDNTAGNLLVASFGGPAGFTRFARSVGDSVTRLDRLEPKLNDVAHGDERDTTSPAAMGETLRRLVLGDVLKPASRIQLTDWLVGNKTGDTRIRAGLPQGWRVGDKTGAGANGESNDVAVIWPPGRGPLILSIYYIKAGVPQEARNKVIAQAARIVAQAV